jgi:glycosyltransferase involved in cell wall biosynthesis
MRNPKSTQADICLVLEGTYPYVSGGVSQWAHELISDLSDHTFHLWTVVTPGIDMAPQYPLPNNVVGITPMALMDLRPGNRPLGSAAALFGRLKTPLLRLQTEGCLDDLKEVIEILAPHRDNLGRRVLLDSREAWDFTVELYQSRFSGLSFLDFFWSWRSLYEGLFSVLLADIPKAGCYHAVSTGYAGLLASRAALETGQPALLTEHGIYTNERRIEISISDWVHGPSFSRLSIDKPSTNLKDFWITTFENYSRVCYQAVDPIITLYQGNQRFQKVDGAPPEKFRIIPNGIDYPAFASIVREKNAAPTIALIGRVVPIKDVKTYIRAAALLVKSHPDLLAYVIGPKNADPGYFQECLELVAHLGLEKTILFTGRVDTKDYLGRVDVNVLTSVSEAQPLVILEAAALGIPSVATDVGSCSELVLGHSAASSALGPGGAITPLSNPQATAQAIDRLLSDGEWRELAGRAAQERVRRYYNKADLVAQYRDIYGDALKSGQYSLMAEV